MRWLVAAIGAGLGGCGGAAPRALVVVDDDDPVASWKPPDSADADTASAGLEPGACGADLSWEEGDLELLGCARVSPEPVDEGLDTGITLETGMSFGAPNPPPPPCSYSNLMGAVGMTGTATAPDLLYCDADGDGGLRWARYDAEGGTVRSSLLVEGTCWVDLMSGAVSSGTEGLRAWWVEQVSSEDATATELRTALLDPQGEIAEDATSVPGTEDARRVVALGTSPTSLVVEDMTGAVSVLDPASGEAVTLAESVWSFGAAAAGPGAVVMTCEEETFILTVSALDGAGALAWRMILPDSSCGWIGAPAVTGDDEIVVLTWDDGDQGTIAFLSADGAVLGVESLGKDSLLPVASLLGDAVWTADSSGTVSRWTRDGALEASWVHRGVAEASGYASGLRFSASDEALSFAFVGMDTESLGNGHVNTFYYLESSVSAVPTP